MRWMTPWWSKVSIWISNPNHPLSLILSNGYEISVPQLELIFYFDRDRPKVSQEMTILI